eukprot:TRINITY_DN1999_c0_g1_i1.p1 TRINITY_DN1999_c0_g1~~TRINITY_DN1999_c0_g1_i1.p1  ORF type:complete len:122 (+),score=7.78 TRINITY_DN1999_c0_g1_i1:96-461(+)
MEQLTLQNLMWKTNRKLVAAVCYLIAFKFNEPIVLNKDKERFSTFLRCLSKTFEVRRTDILRAEFQVFVKLKFDLHVKVAAILPHFERLLRSRDLTPVEYLQGIGCFANSMTILTVILQNL